MAAMINGWIAYVFKGLAWMFVVFGVVMGTFGWMNSGLRAGIGLYFVSGLLAVAATASVALFRFVSKMHAVEHPHRWWMQLGSVVVLYVIFGLVASATTLLDRMK
jgi:hypothetical protein